MSLMDIVNIITAVVTAASTITVITPTPKDDNVMSKLYKVIEFLGLVVGKAKDK